MRIFSIMTMAAVTAGCALLAGCNTNGCLENRNSVPLAGFYNGDDKPISLDSVQVCGVGMPEDDPLVAAGKSINSLYLPMRSTQPVTAWVFSYKWNYLDNPAYNDTITFVYDSSPFFASDECGVIYKYHITEMSHTSHLISSVVITDSLVTNTDVERIKIYFRTADNDSIDNQDENE